MRIEVQDQLNLWSNTMPVRGIGFTWYRGAGVVVQLWHKQIHIRRR